MERQKPQQSAKATELAPQITPAPSPIQSPNAAPRVAAGGLRVTPGGGAPRGIAPTRGGESGSGLERDIKTALGGLQKVAKPAGQAIDALNAPNFGTFDRGASEPAFQAQRAGERQDFSPAALTSLDVPSMPGVFQNFPNVSPNFNVGSDTTFSMIPGSSPSTSVPSMPSTGGMNAGMSASQLGGLAASGLGGLASAYGLYQGIESGSPSAIAGGAYGLGTAGLSGAAAAGSTAAQTAMAAAGPWLSVAAPIVVGVLGYLQAQEQKAAMRKAGLKLRGQLGEQQNRVGQEGIDLSQVDPNRIDPTKQQQYVDLLNRMFQTQDPTSGAGQIPTAGIAVGMSPMENAYHMANAGPNPSATGDNQAQMNEYGKNILASVPAQYQRLVYELMQNPNLKLPSWEVGGNKTADVLRDMQAGMGVAGQAGPAPDYNSWYEHLPGTPQPYVTETQFGPQGPEQYTVPNPALGGQFPTELLSSPYFAQAYWQSKGVTPQQAFLYGAGQQAQQFGGMTGLPGAEGGFGAYDPAALYQLLLSQGMPDLSPQQQPTAGATAPQEAATPGSMETSPIPSAGGPGGTAVGGAGKIAPTFATPELDRVAEITSAGKRQGAPAPQAQQPGKPFGMGQPPQQGAFGMRGGMAVSGGPFGMPPRGGQQNARSGNGNLRGTV